MNVGQRNESYEKNNKNKIKEILVKKLIVIVSYISYPHTLYHSPWQNFFFFFYIWRELNLGAGMFRFTGRKFEQLKINEIHTCRDFI